MLDHPLLDEPISPAYPNAYNVWVGQGDVVTQLAVWWYTESRGHPPGDTDLRHGQFRLLNEGDRWGTLRAAFQNTWPIPGQEHAVPRPTPAPPSPSPQPPSGTPANVDPRVTDLTEFVKRVGEASPYWPAARNGDGVAAHRVTRVIAKALAVIDPRWGLITKQPGQQQCSWDWCGPGDGTGYGEDVVAFLPGPDHDAWIGYDAIGGAGAPGARVQWSGPIPIRHGNRWTPLPEPIDAK